MEGEGGQGRRAQCALPRWGWPDWMCSLRQRNKAREREGLRAVTQGAEAQKLPPL